MIKGSKVMLIPPVNLIHLLEGTFSSSLDPNVNVPTPGITVGVTADYDWICSADGVGSDLL